MRFSNEAQSIRSILRRSARFGGLAGIAGDRARRTIASGGIDLAGAGEVVGRATHTSRGSAFFKNGIGAAERGFVLAAPIKCQSIHPIPTVLSHDARDADWVATSGADVIHVECQGYRDPGFLERLFWYHLGFTLCHCTRHVRSVALWLTRPSADQRVGRIVHGDVTLHTTTVVLAEEPAAAMLQGDGTACFAPGADPGPWSVSELCQRTAARMVERNAGYYERHMAVVAAMMRGRYDEMVKAMSDHNMEPVIIEDLVKFGEDRGREEGLAEGLLSLVRVIERKMGRACTGEERAKLRMLLVEVGPERVADVAMDSDGAQLAAWLSAPVAK